MQYLLTASPGPAARAASAVKKTPTETGRLLIMSPCYYITLHSSGGARSPRRYTRISMLRVRFAPSPTGYLHIGGARTYIFNWLYARRHGGTMVLRIDDTDVERNTDQSLRSIFDGLAWLGLDWDEQYRQSERLALHEKLAWDIFERGMAYRDFTPADTEDTEKAHTGTWLFNPGQREISPEESDHRASLGEKFVLRFRVPRDADRAVAFHDLVYGEQSKMAADIEDFALLR